MKVALVIQRYGPEIVGGSESFCRAIAGRLKEFFAIDIITTCAKDFMAWGNYFPAGVTMENGVAVRRFPVDRPRSCNFLQLNENFAKGLTPQQEREWLEGQGPYSSELFWYITHNWTRYDAVIFVTYLYCTTVLGSEKVENGILIPTAHDEPPIYLSIFDEVVSRMKGFIFLTEEERSFFFKRFRGATEKPNAVIGMGIPVPELPPEADPNPPGPFLTYVGRITEGKGCLKLFRYFQVYKSYCPETDLHLLLMGESDIPIPTRNDVKYLGFLSEQEKLRWLSGSLALVQPSPFESFSIVTLEAMACSRPVLVNGQSEVLKGHVVRSNAGLYYENFPEFAECLNYLLEHPGVTANMGQNGRKYVMENYHWPVIVQKYADFIKGMAKRVSPGS